MKLKDIDRNKLNDKSILWLAKNGYKHWLAKNGYIDWLADNGYIDWLAYNDLPDEFLNLLED